MAIQKKETETLSTSLLKLTHGKEHELLYAKPIMLQCNEFGSDGVSQIVKAWLLKLSESIGDNLIDNKNRLDTLSEDLIETYYYDSLEDIRECLKKGRRGEYGFGHHKRGYVTMLLLREWMGKHLDQKAQIREKEIEKQKVNVSDVENFDAKRFYEIGAKFLKAQKENEKKRNSFSSATYEAIKHDYFKDKDEK